MRHNNSSNQCKGLYLVLISKILTGNKAFEGIYGNTVPITISFTEGFI